MPAPNAFDLIAGALIVAAIIGYKKMDLIFSARGLRNNNPGNIKRNSTEWLGMSADQSADNTFVVFESPEYGIRAMSRILSSYAGRGLVSVREIISTWAPAAENNTAAYIDSVATRMGVTADEPLLQSDWPQLIAEIIRHENGHQPYSMELIAHGVSLA